MSLVPKKKPERTTFFASKISPWTTNSAALNVEPAAVATLDTRVEAARDAQATFVAARAAARSAGINYDQAVRGMTLAGTAIISQIRTTAQTGGDAIYALADLPAPPTPRPVPAPGTPSDFVAALGGDGSVKITWKCVNPRGSTGTMYQVYRRVGGAGEFSYVGGVGAKEFTDSAVPAGATTVTYQIQAVRSTAAGGWAQFNVNFGTSAGGATTATVAASTVAAPRLAA